MKLSTISNTNNDQSKNKIQQPMRRPIIHVFTGFRALACLWIFMYHNSVDKNNELALSHTTWITWGGAAGVTLFFCLSGFIMVWTYGDCEFKSTRCYWSFIGRRAARLFPLYYLSLLLSIYDIQYVWRKDTSCTIENWIFILSTLCIVQTFIPYNFGDQLWNASIWSVQTEWFFYLVFPFLLRSIRSLLHTTKISLLSNVTEKKKALKRLYLMWCIVLCISAIPLILPFVLLKDASIVYSRL